MINSKNIEDFLIKALAKIDEKQNEKFENKWDSYSEYEQQALVEKVKSDYLARRENKNIESTKVQINSSEVEYSNVVSIARSKDLILESTEAQWEWSDLYGAAAYSGETVLIVNNLFRLTAELLKSEVKGFRLEFKGEGVASLKVTLNAGLVTEPKTVPFRVSIGGKYKEVHNLEFNSENKRVKVFSLKELVRKDQFKIGCFLLNMEGE